MSCQPVVRDRDPVVRHREPLPHDALIGTVQSKRHLDVVSAVFGDEPKDVADLVHRLSDDALALGAGIQSHEPVGRDDRAKSVDCEADAEAAPVIVEIAVRHHDVVVRRKLLPRLVVEQCEEPTAMQLVVVSTGIARMREIPVDAVPVGEHVAHAPTGTPPNAEVVDFDLGGEICSLKDCRNAIKDSLKMCQAQALLMHDVDGSSITLRPIDAWCGHAKSSQGWCGS